MVQLMQWAMGQGPWPVQSQQTIWHNSKRTHHMTQLKFNEPYGTTHI